jgi:hypothetical protein
MVQGMPMPRLCLQAPMAPQQATMQNPNSQATYDATILWLPQQPMMQDPNAMSQPQKMM